MKNPTAAIIIIGNEILSGRTQDKNINYLAKGLNELGIILKEVRVIPDDEQVIIGTLNALRSVHDYIFTSGGIGPTHDDITADAVAKAFSLPLILHEEAFVRLEKHYATKGVELNDSRKKMAYTPKGATLIDNPISAAPGFIIGNVYVMAGVPSIMQAMFDSIAQTLKGGAKVESVEIMVSLAEGTIAAPLAALQREFKEVDMGSYPFIRDDGTLGTSLVLRSSDTVKLAEAKARVEGMVAAIL